MAGKNPEGSNWRWLVTTNTTKTFVFFTRPEMDPGFPKGCIFIIARLSLKSLTITVESRYLARR